MWCDVSLSNIMGILIAGYPLVVYPVTYMKVWNASMVSCSENDLHSWFWFSTWQSWPAGNSLSVCYGKSPFLNVVPSGKLLHNYGKSPCYQWVNPRTKWAIFNSYFDITRGSSFSYGFPLIFPCSYGFPMVLWECHGIFIIIYVDIGHGFYGFQLDSLDPLGR